MAKREPDPYVAWNEPHTSTDVRELFRYRKASRTRVYNLRIISEAEAELWVVSEEGHRSRKLVTFDNPDDAVPFIQDVERELREGGWREI